MALAGLHRTNPGRPVRILDTKGEGELLAWTRRHRYAYAAGERAALALLRSSRPPVRLHARVFDPRSREADDLLRLLYLGPPATVVVDEAMHWPRPDRNRHGMRLLLTAGMGRWIGVWAATQRPVNVANEFLSESLHRVVFRLELESDRKKIGGVVGDQAAARCAGLDRFCWLYHAPGSTAVVYGPIRPQER